MGPAGASTPRSPAAGAAAGCQARGNQASSDACAAAARSRPASAGVSLRAPRRQAAWCRPRPAARRLRRGDLHGAALRPRRRGTPRRRGGGLGGGGRGRGGHRRGRRSSAASGGVGGRLGRGRLGGGEGRRLVLAAARAFGAASRLAVAAESFDIRVGVNIQAAISATPWRRQSPARPAGARAVPRQIDIFVDVVVTHHRLVPTKA